MNQQKTCFKSYSIITPGQKYTIQVFSYTCPLTLPHLHCSPSTFQFLPSADGEVTEPGQANSGAMAWVGSAEHHQSAGQHWADIRIHALTSHRRTLGCLPRCHKWLGRKVLRVCGLFWLFLQWNKALAHIKGPEKLPHRSPGAGWVCWQL